MGFAVREMRKLGVPLREQNSDAVGGKSSAQTGMLDALFGSARLVSDGAGEVEVDVDFFLGFEDEEAWVFEAPLDVGDGEACFGGGVVGVDVDLHGDGDVVWVAEEGDDASDLNGGVAGGGDVSCVAPGGEGDGGVFLGFEDVFVHLFIAALVAGVATACGDDDGACHGVSAVVVLDRAGLDVEAAENVVVVGFEGHVNFASAGIDGEGAVLR